MVESACLQELGLLRNIQNSVRKLEGLVDSEFSDDRLIADWVMKRRGNLFELKKEITMNTTALAPVPSEIRELVEVSRITLWFNSANARTVALDFIPGHVSGDVYERMYSVSADTARSIVIVFGEDYQYTDLQSIKIALSAGTAGDKVYATVTLKSLKKTL